MQPYQNLNSAGLAQELRQVRQDLDAWKARGLKLNMARGSRARPAGHGQRHSHRLDPPGAVPLRRHRCP